ncbi:CvpA family protein [Moraxella nasibovis]|uniref:CvpA family protein n=1 Tax=Moraxella nasibovis TaxID=2904120 RepID=UPI00240EF76D|nr:CvpA family protein [Moraxella nasibovis]WFF39625.1 CvpA family protein [Moraxella nasibovis]
MSHWAESMTWIDLFIMVMVLLGMWRGFGAGFVKTAASLISWLLALVVASRLAKSVAPLLAEFISNPILQIAAAFLVVALVVMMAVQLLAMSLTGLFKRLKLGFLDRILGGVLGAVTGVLKVLIILSIASPLLVHLPNWQTSILAQNLLPLAPVAVQLLQEVLGETWQQIQNPYQS